MRWEIISFLQTEKIAITTALFLPVVTPSTHFSTCLKCLHSHQMKFKSSRSSRQVSLLSSQFTRWNIESLASRAISSLGSIVHLQCSRSWLAFFDNRCNPWEWTSPDACIFVLHMNVASLAFSVQNSSSREQTGSNYRQHYPTRSYRSGITEHESVEVRSILFTISFVSLPFTQYVNCEKITCTPACIVVSIANRISNSDSEYAIKISPSFFLMFSFSPLLLQGENFH